MRPHRCSSVQPCHRRSAARPGDLFTRLIAASGLAVFALAFMPVRGSDRGVAVAIKDAKIVTVSGSTIAKGTLVWRDGIIQAVGANVSIPADARVIDGAGLTVYPGLIDASTSLGLTAPAQPAGGGRGRGGAPAPQPAGQQPNEPPATLNPDVAIADEIRPGGTAIEQERSVGVTTALSANSFGLYLGQSALINLNGEKTEDMVVKAPVALDVALQSPRAGGYPGSLMGVMAYLRQNLLDAQHYKAEWDNYEAHKRGTRRPEPDKALEALVPVIMGKLPVIFHVDSVNDIKRAAGLAEEFHLKYAINGGMEAFKIAGWLKQKNVSVVVNLNFPRPNPNADPEADTPLRVLQDRADAPKNAEVLTKAGVKIAFGSHGVSSADLLPNVRKAIASGLSADAALKALTINAAEILGVPEQLGSLETGKIANMVVTTGDLFATDSKVKYLFIDGDEVEVMKQPERPAGARGQGPPPAPQAASLTGKWELSVSTQNGDVPVTADFTQSGSTLTGSTSSQFGTQQITTGSVNGNRVTFTVNVDAGGQQLAVVFTGTVEGDSISGTVDVAGQGPSRFTGKRNP